MLLIENDSNRNLSTRNLNEKNFFLKKIWKNNLKKKWKKIEKIKIWKKNYEKTVWILFEEMVEIHRKLRKRLNDFVYDVIIRNSKTDIDSKRF